MDFFESYWWLLFPLGFFVFGAWDRWLSYQRSRDHLNLLRELSAQGKDIPPDLLKAVRDPEEEEEPPPALDPYDRYSRRHYRRYWRHRYGASPYWQWRTFFVTGAVAAGFWFASEFAGWPGVDGPFRLVAIILTCVAVGHGLAALFTTTFFPRR